MTDATPKPPEGYKSWIEYCLECYRISDHGEEEARAELALLREDKARLDWLQSRPWHVNVGSGPPESRIETRDDDLRAAIDAARKETP